MTLQLHGDTADNGSFADTKYKPWDRPVVFSTLILNHDEMISLK